ncbi:MAG: hypothetical protein QOJ65_1987 [Fimbriimonadaceae bacterium]|nr:hypothetical protein [Fimbriimonadaceae bacterium]
MPGSRIIEISGLVKGSFRVADRGALIVERPSGGTQIVDCGAIPDWLVGNEVRARLIVKVTKADATAETKAELIGVAPENLVAPHDAQPPIAPTTSKTLTSRSGSRSPRAVASVPINEAVPIYASFIKSRNRRLTDAKAMEIANGVIRFSMHYGVDARLIMAMVMVESGFNPNATSRTGARGLGQLMPGTAAGLGVADSYDTIQNLYGTVKLVRSNLDLYAASNGASFRALVLAIAAYNAGNGAVKRHGGVPPYAETQNYVNKVINLYRQFRGD